MAGYLIAEEGPLAGLVISFEEGTEWILGRDPDEATIVLEDPMVSRKHVICHLTSEGLILENLSSVNPATQNGKIITEEVLLKEGDILEIGTTFFRFTEKDPSAEDSIPEDVPTVFEEEEPLSTFDFEAPLPTRWLLKVISGPNAGAEFSLEPGRAYILGKDSNVCDVVFYDLSVSKEHAKIYVDEEERIFIEDLGSRNGVLVNGDRIEQRQEVISQDLIALGTTSCLLIDRQQSHETIISPVATLSSKVEEQKAAESELPEAITAEKAKTSERNWKELVIPQKHLILGGIFALFLLGIITASFSLFKSKEIELPIKHEKEKLADALKPFPSIQFSLNESTGKLFLIGHVLTNVEKQELSYTISTLPFISSVEDTVIIDELVWQNINALLLSYPAWQAVSIHSPVPGKFVMKGYVQTPQDAEALSDYMNINFPYLDLLENDVNVANTLTLQIQTLLLQNGFHTLVFDLTGGDLILTGTLDKKRSSDLDTLVKYFKKLPGVLSVKNFVVIASHSQGASIIDLSPKYSISGFSSGDNDMQFAIINAKIFGTGDLLDGMLITAIEPEQVLLEKDGIKFRINYNLQ